MKTGLHLKVFALVGLVAATPVLALSAYHATGVDARALPATGVALAIALVNAWLIGRHISGRIGNLAVAAAEMAARSNVAGTAPLVDESGDEIGHISGSFNTLLSRLLASQGREIELLLENVTQGLVIVDAAGQMGAHHSAVMARWFGPIAKGAPIWSLFARHDPNASAYFELAWESLFDGFLPAEVALDQFPKRLRHGSSTFELVIRPIPEGEGALVVLTDVTDEIAREESDATRRDVIALCERALSDRNAVTDFVSEGDSIHRAIEIGETLIDLKRAVHTLKGVAAQAGAASIAGACARVEAGMVSSENDAPRSVDIALLTGRWLALTSHLRVLFENAAVPVHVERRDIDHLVHRVDASASHTELGRLVRLMRLEPMQIRLDRAKDAALLLAKRLGKDLEVTGNAGLLRCDATAWMPLWSAFGHVVRNAVDHGIESTEARINAGKSPCGKLSLDIERCDGRVVLTASDDGAGIDWRAIAEQAGQHGLPNATARDLENALFADGLSTVAEAHEVSGHGIGLGAIRAIAEAMGGQIEVESTRGVGTTFRISIPIAMLGDAYDDPIFYAVAA